MSNPYLKGWYSKCLGLGEISFREYLLTSNVICGRWDTHSPHNIHYFCFIHDLLQSLTFLLMALRCCSKVSMQDIFFFKILTFRFGTLNCYKHTARLWDRELRTTTPWPLLDQPHLHFSIRCDLQPGASSRLPHSILWSRFWALGSNLDQHAH